jgi:hypothetical protein
MDPGARIGIDAARQASGTARGANATTSAGARRARRLTP